MAIKIPNEPRKRIFTAVYKKADECGYMECSRIKSGEFMDSLVDEPDIGVKLTEYMPKERVRTYIKDTILNRYTKAKKEEMLKSLTPEATVKKLYGVDTVFVDKIFAKGNRLDIMRAENGSIYIVSSGTTLKWETALKKALLIVADRDSLKVNGTPPSICLKLSTGGEALTEADKNLIEKAVGIVNIKVVFCSI